jgi:hypothetical protein
MKDLNKTEVKVQLLNLLAVGAFLWYLMKAISSMTFTSFKSFGIIAGIEPNFLCWTNQTLTILIICVSLFVILKKVWKKVIDETISTKKFLISLGIAILLVQILQFFLGFYVSDILITHYEVAVLSYQDVVNEIDRSRLIYLSFSLGETILLLLIFIKWK